MEHENVTVEEIRLIDHDIPHGSYPDMREHGWEKDEKIDTPKGYDSDFTNRNTTCMTYNLLHLASLLKSRDGYPKYGNSIEDWKKGERWQFKNP